MQTNAAKISQAGDYRALPCSTECSRQPTGCHEGRSVQKTPDATAAQLPVPADNTMQTPVALRRLASRAQLDDPHLPINFFPTGRSPLEGLIPEPHVLLPLEKDKDQWLSRCCQSSETSQKAFDQWLDAYRRAEEAGQEFCFAPLQTTLENMFLFVRHIRANKQFHRPLTQKEDKAMAWVEEKTLELLLEPQPPYKRTVHLAIAFMTLYEIVTDRQVLEPLKTNKPGAFEEFVVRRELWSESLGHPDADGEAGVFSAVALDPEQVAAFCWGGNNPGGADEAEQLFSARAGCYAIWEALAASINKQHLLIYPSFQELSCEDFCRFGHLPLHPVGMITRYAQNADGVLMSPLEFAAHDLTHLNNLQTIGDPELMTGQHFLRQPVERLIWRCLLREQTPACLAGLQLEPALQLVLFQLLHEQMPSMARFALEDAHSGFFWLLRSLAYARREGCNGYPPEIREQVSDAQAVLATCWTVRLWHKWQTVKGAVLPDGELDALAQEFVAKDVLVLQRHMDFVQQHTGCLRQLFSEHCDPVITNEYGHRRFCLPADFPKLRGYEFFRDYGFGSGLHHLDHTDLAYLAALDCPRLRREIEERTCVAPPEGQPCASALPEPGLTDLPS